MKTTTWRKLFAMGFVVSAFAAGCVITSDDDDDENTGGTSGSGGSAGGGSGGKAGTGGKAGSGGSGGSGGKVSCSDPIPRDDAGVVNTCQQCIQQDCCAEYLDCFNNDARCEDEIICIQDCILDVVEDGDPVTDDVKSECFNDCRGSNSTVAVATSNLFGCIDTGDKGDAAPVEGCALECLEGEPITD